MSPIWTYLVTDALPQEAVKAGKVRHQASHYVIINNEMFKRAISRPLLKCVDEDHTNYILDEVR